MIVLPVHNEVLEYLAKRKLVKKFEKQIRMLESNIFHPSLETELLEPKHLRFWSFRVNKKYRAIFIFREKNVIEIIDVNNHYR
ncbi:hypothetical protein A2733_01065 [Candidatus Nomurabacteria bacterium RIFCSPHIGHO2_01_FULL_40_20]|uniref:Toxin YoeB n=1 Tax=Candidatus Nomurabacteria bacterium RIFCSPHIGHO2_01_FULL_40_20 TaxID=1801738 RepID=A0A1F6V393_9BACT|nr:MAG: hypothetical protein A2733_01065 [Candidatus Nomurabacteria bacterium RIFCSPHIGHO2_01_FULL_40_20]